MKINQNHPMAHAEFERAYVMLFALTGEIYFHHENWKKNKKITDVLVDSLNLKPEIIKFFERIGGVKNAFYKLQDNGIQKIKNYCCKYKIQPLDLQQFGTISFKKDKKIPIVMVSEFEGREEVA